MNTQKNRTAWALSLGAALALSALAAWAQFKAAAETGPVLQPRAVIGNNRTVGIAFLPDGKGVWLAYGSKAELWDLETGESKMTLQYHSDERPDFHMGGIYSLAISPDGKTMASGAQRGELKFWDPETGKIKAAGDLSSGDIRSVAWSPDGSVVAAAQSFSNSVVKLVDPASGNVKATLEVSKYTGIKIVIYSPDGKFLATAPNDTGNTVKLFNAKTGVLAKTLAIPERVPGRSYQDVGGIAFSPDSKTLATGGGHTGYLLDVATGRIRATLPHEERDNHEDQVAAVAFSPDGKLVATACQDGTAKLWDAATGKLKATLKGQYAFSIIAFTPDGKTVVAGASESTKIYDVPEK
jgi:WD40 repeat protein